MQLSIKEINLARKKKKKKNLFLQPVAGKYIEFNFSLKKQVLRCLFFFSSFFSSFSVAFLEKFFSSKYYSIQFEFFFLFYCGDTLVMLTRAWKCVHCTLISIYNCIGNNNDNNNSKKKKTVFYKRYSFVTCF